MASDHRGNEVGENHSNWKRGFVGTFHGSLNGQAFFSAEATGGGQTDSLQIPWAGQAHSRGQRFAMIPDLSKRHIPEGEDMPMPESWTAHAVEKHHEGLPGYPKKES